MNFDIQRQQRVTHIEAVIKQYAPVGEGYQQVIMEAMNYSLMAGGKRLRPMLMEETFCLFGGKHQPLIEPFMVALEMIHTYSLVHDDLPAMDNDDYRRGRKTTHVVYGEALGILAGDGLLNYAFETAAKTFGLIEGADETQELQYYKRVTKALEILSNKAGIYGMIGGQVIDMEGTDLLADRQRLDHMYHLKTGALIEAAMMIGAVLAGAEDTQVRKIEAIAGDIGLAFQIKDDILDVTSTAQVLGKPIHSDEKNAKTTYVSILGLTRAEQEVERISKRALEEYDALSLENEFLRELIIELIDRKN